jgi:pyoverdine/dityrosine biosynthesis protein Dit1
MALPSVNTLPPQLPVHMASHDVAVGKPEPLAALFDNWALETSSKILDIIGRYRMKKDDIHSRANESSLRFIALIYTHVKAQRPVPLCLPAFPFKSPNATSKVLGTLPDKAEEFALSHLNGLCQAIKDIYAPGATLTIISDGLVYNGQFFFCHANISQFCYSLRPKDLLSVPDKDVWNYGEALRALAAAKGLEHIVFARLGDLVTINLPSELDEMTYVANASNFRRALLNTFSRPDWSWEEVRQGEDACLTYRGYIKFLQTDLETVYPIGENRTKSKYKRGLEYIAKQMMARGDVSGSRPSFAGF